MCPTLLGLFYFHQLIYMSLLLEPDSADTDYGESQNYEHDPRSLAWHNIETDRGKMAALGKIIGEIVNSKDNLPDQIIEAATTVLEISEGFNANMIPLCLLARIANPLLFSRYRTTRRVSSGL